VAKTKTWEIKMEGTKRRKATSRGRIWKRNPDRIASHRRVL